MEIFAERLKELRNEQNLSQRKLAKALGVNQKTISSYENNAYEPPQALQVEIADFFGVTLDYLMGRTEE